MKSYLFMSTCLIINCFASNTKYCPYQPELIPEYTNDNTEDSADIYFYIPIEIRGLLMNNSIFLYDDNANLLDCLDDEAIFEFSPTLTQIISYFANIKYVTNNLFVISYTSYNSFGLTLTSKSWKFIDDYFKLRQDLPEIKMSANIESSIFDDNASLNAHDIILTEDLTYAIILITESNIIDDVQLHLPGAAFSSFNMMTDGLCAIDMKTGKETAAKTGDGLFVDLDIWWQYFGNSNVSRLYLDTSSESTSNFNTIVIHATHINAMNLINGGHFSTKYENKELILIHSRRQDTSYLLNWDFKGNNDNSFEIVWKLPMAQAPDVVKQEWSNRWEFVNDPLFGVSMAHDLNIENLPKQHMLFFDNGYNHRTANLYLKELGISCPMSRAVEYKIEMDINGKLGYNRITLVFSYPSVSKYPEFIYLENAPLFDKIECRNFWKDYNLQYYLGSVRKTDNGDYVMTHYDDETLRMQMHLYSPRMLKVNSDGKILNKWYAVNQTSASYKIYLIKRNKFRNGIYYNGYDDVVV